MVQETIECPGKRRTPGKLDSIFVSRTLDGYSQEVPQIGENGEKKERCGQAIGCE
jgi:hypothetical protein